MWKVVFFGLLIIIQVKAMQMTVEDMVSRVFDENRRTKTSSLAKVQTNATKLHVPISRYSKLNELFEVGRREGRMCADELKQGLKEEEATNLQEAKSLCSSVEAYIGITHVVDEYCNEVEFLLDPMVNVMKRLCQGEAEPILWITIARVGANDNTREFWSKKCLGMTLEHGDIVRVKMGENVDYYKPTSYPMPFCDFIKSDDNFLWASEANGNYIPPTPKGEPDCWGCTIEDWPRHNVPDDNRRYLSVWGPSGGQGGCCHATKNDKVAWNRPFEMAIAKATII